MYISIYTYTKINDNKTTLDTKLKIAKNLKSSKQIITLLDKAKKILAVPAIKTITTYQKSINPKHEHIVAIINNTTNIFDPNVIQLQYRELILFIFPEANLIILFPKLNENIIKKNKYVAVKAENAP